MTPPNILADMIAEALADGGADPDAVAADVVARMTPFEREQVVRDIARKHAQKALTKHSVVHTVPRPTVVPDLPVEQHEPPSPPVRPVPLRPVRSAKVAGIRDWWQTFVTEPVTIAGKRKTMGECTTADLLVLARYDREYASRAAARADKLDVLAKRMKDTGAHTVRELPRQHVQSALSA